jgi:sugar lactone lactonase YvrE
MKRFYILLSIVCLQRVHGQIITTVAGNGQQGYTGDGGQATSAKLWGIFGVAVDINGNIFISDYWDHVIRKVNSAGIISTIAGNGTAGWSGDGGPATSAKINSPYHIATDLLGNIYFADAGGTIRKINTSGIISTIAGNGTAGYSGDGGLATSAQLNSPVGVAVDGLGNVYIADNNNNVIRKVNTSGIISTVAGTGTSGYDGDSIAATTSQLAQPTGVAVDLNGNLYISDWVNTRIRKVDANGIITTIAGTGTNGQSANGVPATSANLSWPRAVLSDAQGNVYIADESNSEIRMVNSAGIINTIAGLGPPGGFSGDGGPATSAQIDSPSALAFDASGNLYFTDESNFRIRKITNVAGGITSSSNSTNSISICPNPASDQFFIYANTTDKLWVDLYDVHGRHVFNTIALNKSQINISALDVGVYSIVIRTAACVINKKLVVAR